MSNKSKPISNLLDACKRLKQEKDENKRNAILETYSVTDESCKKIITRENNETARVNKAVNNLRRKPVNVEIPKESSPTVEEEVLHKLVSYNTSWPLDAHYSQLHQFLSESAAIVAKAIEIYEFEKPEEKLGLSDFSKLIDHFKSKLPSQYDDINRYVNGKLSLFKVNNAITDVGIKTDLGIIRMQMADAITDYLEKQLKDKVAFVALVEQTIHVPSDHQAFYTKLENYNLDKLSEKDGKPFEDKPFLGKNTIFGILKRINKLKLDDVDRSKSGEYERYATYIHSKEPYFVVYDNVVNTSALNAEGIGIIVSKEICPTLFTWNKQEFPNIKRGNAKDAINAASTVHYYSDDLGQVLHEYANFVNNEGNMVIRYTLLRGDGAGPDLGRPIIMTAGLNGDELNVFVSLHNVNISNLMLLSDKFYSENADVVSKINYGNKSATDLKNILMDSISTGKLQKLGASNDDELKAKIYDKVYEGIVEFINAGLTSCIGLTINDSTVINLFLGGDFNDPDAEILKRLINENGILIMGKPVKIILSNKDDKLYSCCANRDSQKYRKDGTPIDKYTDEQKLNEIDIERNRTLASLSGAFERIIGNYTGNVSDASITTNSNFPYPKGFYKADSFGYFGDYSLYGTSNPLINPQSTITVESEQNASYSYSKSDPTKYVMASDHLPVYATVIIPQHPSPSAEAAGGGRRRRYSMRVLKRHTKKGLPKKIRASRRKRRASTYKKH